MIKLTTNNPLKIPDNTYKYLTMKEYPTLDKIKLNNTMNKGMKIVFLSFAIILLLL